MAGADRTPPAGAYTFPTNGAFLNPLSWASGCAAGEGFCGTASDTSGVADIRLAIRLTATGRYWSGLAFDRVLLTYLPAQLVVNGTNATWSFALRTPPDGTYSTILWVADRAGNVTTGTPPTRRIFTIDSQPPATPTITTGKFDDAVQVLASSGPGSASFGFALARPLPSGERVECALGRDVIPSAGAFKPCTPPASFVNLEAGRPYCVVVRALDRAGNTSSDSYCWYTVTGGTAFAISGNAQRALDGAGDTVPIDLHFVNPFPFPFVVTSVDVTITTDAPGCPARSNFTVVHPFRTAVTLPVGPSSLLALAVPTANWPSIGMVETNDVQDACIGAHLTLSYDGTGHKA